MPEAQAFGHNSYFGLGEETVWGTPVARTVFGEFIGDSMKAIVARAQSGAFRRRNQMNHFAAKQGAEGGLDVECSYIDKAVLRLLKHLFGAVSTAADTPVVGTHTHTFTLADAPPVGLSLEIHRDASSAFLYAGYRINEGTFSLEPDGLLKLAVSGAAKAETLVSATSPTYDTANLVQHSQAAVTWGGVSKEVTNFELAIANALALDRRILGSRNIAAPVAEGKREVTGSFPKFFDNIAEYNDFVAATSRALVLTLTGGIITGSTNFKITFTLADVVLEGETPVVDSPGFLSQPLTFRAYETASVKPVSCAVITNVATV